MSVVYAANGWSFSSSAVEVGRELAKAFGVCRSTTKYCISVDKL